MPLVLVRTPTYRGSEPLQRAIQCLRAQSHGEWICEVRDDCPDGSARSVLEELRDPRVRYVHNQPQKFGVQNLDDCFRLENAFHADYFFMLEDDNQVRPEFGAP
ncbi:glycosyltransferase [Devosia sp. 1566]|uniref:glycosyltransferase family 2 protein n=1 Tax=Devosia sp. 1566 TaxID=2499144 RepID=UPI000FD90434|nr:glycosyltransferase [Devosia sp. 1566]